MSTDQTIWCRLYAVPKDEIVKCLRSKFQDDKLVARCQNIIAEIATIDQIRKASYKQLILIAEQLDEFTEDDAQHLHEEFRYRGTKTLYLAHYSAEYQNSVAVQLEDISLDKIDEIVQTIFQSSQGNKSLHKYEQLSIREKDTFLIDANLIWEISYSYVTTLRTTDPETEEGKFHPDLRYSFAWVNCTNPWVAVSAKDEAIATVLLDAIREILNLDILRLPIPKDVEIALEQYENVRRASHIDERGVRTRISHENLYDFPEEIEDLQSRDYKSERLSSGYNATLRDIEFVFNYSRDKGAISFSKLLPTSMLREFGVSKINEIYGAIQEYRHNQPEVLIPEITHRALLGSKKMTKELVTKILAKLTTARHTGQSEIELDVNVLRFLPIDKFFSVSVQTECEYCDDFQDIQCHCNHKSFEIQDTHIICKKCKAALEIGDGRCIIGHDIHIADPTQMMTLNPTTSLLEIVETVTSQASSAKYNRHEEGFYVRGKTLHVFGQRGDKTIYLLGDIPELASLAKSKESEEQHELILAALDDYKEKCKHMSNENCSSCVSDRIGQHCMMRLYGLFDSSYTPRPHHNGEFGDVSLNVTIDGHQQQTLVILMKSGKPTGSPVTMRHPIGQDLYTQIVPFLTDPRVAIIGIAVPQRIEDGFAAQLQRLVRKHNKKLVFFGPDELANLVEHVMDEHNLEFDAL